MYDYGYGYDYGYVDTGAGLGMLGGLAAMGAVISIVSIVLGITMLVSMWKMFKKAGKPGWAAIVPVYNIIVMIEVAGLPLWYIVLFLIPFANIFAMFKVFIGIAHKFGKSTGFGVLSVFFSVICIPILAFSKNAIYEGASNNNQINNTIPTNQINPAEVLQNSMVNENAPSNANAPFVFDQNINTQINPIPVANTNVNVEASQPVMPAPIVTESTPVAVPEVQPTNGFTYNQVPVEEPAPTIPSSPVVEQPVLTVPVETNTVENVPMGSDVVNSQPNVVPTPVPMTSPEPQVNVIPGMGEVVTPTIPVDNSNNNPTNIGM